MDGIRTTAVIMVLIIIGMSIFGLLYDPSVQSEEDKKFWAIVDYRDSLSQMNYREYNTIIPGLDLRSSPDSFEEIIKKNKKSGVLVDVDRQFIYSSFRDSLRAGFRLILNDTLMLTFYIDYDHLLDKVYSIQYTCDYDPKSEVEYNLIYSFLVEMIRKKHPSLIEFDEGYYVKGIEQIAYYRHWMKGNIYTELRMRNWEEYKEVLKNPKFKDVNTFGVEYTDLPYQKQLETHAQDYLYINGYLD